MTTRIKDCWLLNLMLFSFVIESRVNADDFQFIVVVRIPKSVMEEQVNHGFRNTTHVDQVILGTHSLGTAICEGAVTCQPEYNHERATLLVCVKGSVESTTTGFNGPATIQSKANTKYEAQKRVFFDGERFVAFPATITTQTNVEVTGVGSKLPGLRGRLVVRIAKRKAEDSHAEVQAIVADRTKRDLLNHVDTELNSKVLVMNQNLSKFLQILHMLVRKDCLQSRSHADCVSIVCGPMISKNAELSESLASPCKGIEMWIKSGAEGKLEKVTMATLLIKATDWLVSQISPRRSLFAFHRSVVSG